MEHRRMPKIILSRQELIDIQKFIDTFPNAPRVTIECDSTSGIGSILTASVDVPISTYNTTVTVSITDESDW
jgi:hypothetical protein